MIETIKELILDFQELELKTGVIRHIEPTSVEGKATVYMGVRRSGKSTFLFQQIEQLLNKGISRQNILYVNFFDDRLHNLRHEGPAAIIEAYYSLYPEKKNKETVYCFFDEIQEIPGWEPFVDRLLRTENCEITITGSSVHMLSKEIATQMRGRALSWEIFPFSFPEFLDYKKIRSKGPFSSRQRLLIQKAFEEYWECGGFPEVADLDRQVRISIHQEYFNALLFRDLVERHDISHPKAVSDLAHRLINNIASLYSINNLTGYLKSLKHKVPKTSVSDYLEWFEDAYFLFTVRLFDASLSRANVNPKKIYCIDHALVRSVASGILLNAGHLLENLVFTILRRQTQDIYYYRTKGNREVDFIAIMEDRTRNLVQVCESLKSAQTRKRELAALEETMDELNISESRVVTRNEEEDVVVNSGIVHVIPAWRYALQ